MPVNLPSEEQSPVPCRITDVYPSYSNKLLSVLLEDYQDLVEAYLAETGRTHYRLNEMFDFEPVDLHLAGDEVVVSCSLFWKPSSWHKRMDLPKVDADRQIPMEELHRVPHPVFAGTNRENASFFEHYVRHLLEAEWGAARCVVFLAADLQCLKPLLEARGISVIPMRHASLAHSPGAMWRYLGFNLPCRAVYFLDTDRPFDAVRMNRLLELADAHPKAAIVRPLQSTGKGGQMALILGNHFVVRPERVDFDATESMLGYITLNILTEDRLTVFTPEHRHGRNPAKSRLLEPGYCGPNPQERVPLKCFPFYCFDEQWLKEVVYPHFSDGRMITKVQRRNPQDLLQTLDLLYQEEQGNWVV